MQDIFRRCAAGNIDGFNRNILSAVVIRQRRSAGFVGGHADFDRLGLVIVALDQAAPAVVAHASNRRGFGLDVVDGLAFLAGLASFLSPCVLSLVPAYIGYLGGRAAGGESSGKNHRNHPGNVTQRSSRAWRYSVWLRSLFHCDLL